MPRFKICTFELGDTKLSDDETLRIENTLAREATDLRQILEQLYVPA